MAAMSQPPGVPPGTSPVSEMATARRPSTVSVPAIRSVPNGPSPHRAISLGEMRLVKAPSPDAAPGGRSIHRLASVATAAAGAPSD